MSPEPPRPDLRVRQAAAILQSLDPALLRDVESRLSEDERRALAVAREASEEIAPEERRRIIEALTRSPRASATPASTAPPRAPSPEDTGIPAILRPRPDDTARLGAPSQRPLDVEGMLRGCPEAAAQALRRESPMLIALVLGATSPVTAQAVLEHLPSDLGRDAVLLMVNSSLRPAPGVLQCIADALEESVAHHRRRAERRSAHAQLVARTILDDEPGTVRACLEALHANQPGLARDVAAWLDKWAEGDEAQLPAPEPEPPVIGQDAPSRQPLRATTDVVTIDPQSVLNALEAV